MATIEVYGGFLSRLISGDINWLSDDIYVSLLSSSYSPDQDIDMYWDDVLAYEVAGTGYTANGAILSGKTQTYSSVDNTLTIDANDISWTSSTITAGYAVIYDRASGIPATMPLLFYVDFVTEKTSTNGTFSITWNSAGIATFNI